MNYYPVTIHTLNRYTHFKRCVESLAKNTHADKTELIIGLDYPPSEKYIEGYKRIKEYIPTIKGFRKVTVFERTENYGARKNSRALKDYAFEKYEAIISTEDDNEFSPCFLDFMNKALEKYKDDERVSSVQGYNYFRFYNITDNNIYFSHESGAWGIGQWKKKWYIQKTDLESSREILRSLRDSWKIFCTSPAVLSMLMAMVRKGELWGDVATFCKNVLENRYQLLPRVSMVRNWGQDGSGLHCGIDETYCKQEIQTASYFDLDNVELGTDPKINNSFLFFYLLPANKIKAWYYIILTVLRYIKYRINYNE